MADGTVWGFIRCQQGQLSQWELVDSGSAQVRHGQDTQRTQAPGAQPAPGITPPRAICTLGRWLAGGDSGAKWWPTEKGSWRWSPKDRAKGAAGRQPECLQVCGRGSGEPATKSPQSDRQLELFIFPCLLVVFGAGCRQAEFQ